MYDHLGERVWRHLRITNAVAEGLNSKIATVHKRARGYRNPQHFKIACTSTVAVSTSTRLG